MFAGATDPANFEALVYNESMDLATDLMQTRTVIASYCKEVIKNIEDGFSGKHGHIIREIKMMPPELQACSFVFEGRVSNVESHSLTKHALGLSVGRHL